MILFCVVLLVYPTLDVEEEEGSGSKGAGPARKTSESEEDSLWRPQGM